MNENEHLGHTILNAWSRLVNLGERGHAERLKGSYEFRNLRYLCGDANKVDDTGFLTFAVAHDYLESSLRSIKVPYLSVMNNDDSLKEIEEALSELKDLFPKEFVELWSDQKDYMKEAIAFYRKHSITEEESEAVEKEAAITSVYAQCQIEDSLSHRVLSTGTPEPEKIKVSSDIFYFNSVIELLKVSRALPDHSFSLSVIRPVVNKVDPYFALIVKSGGFLSLFTDEPKYNHPLQRERMRNDRHVVERINKSGFPYEVLNLVAGDNDRSLKETESFSGAMVDASKPRVISKFSNISEPSIMFMQALFERIKLNFDFYSQGKTALPVSLIKTEERTDPDANLPILLDQSGYTLKTFDLNSVSREAFQALQEDSIYHKSSNNVWLEAFFENEVKSLMAEMGVTNFLPLGSDKAFLLPDKHQNENRYRGWGEPKSEQIHFDVLSDDVVLTPEEIEQDAVWLARNNYSKLLSKVVETDFKNERGRLIRFVSDTFKRRLSDQTFLEKLCELPEVFYELTESDVEHPTLQRISADSGPRGGKIEAGKKVRASWYFSDSRACYNWNTGMSHSDKYLKIMIHNGVSSDETSVRCCLNPDKRARLFLDINPGNFMELARVLGIELSELPQRLENFGAIVYSGNSLLDRLDPVEAIRTPYDDLRIRIRLCLSVEAINEIRKSIGLRKYTVSGLKLLLKDIRSSSGWV